MSETSSTSKTGLDEWEGSNHVRQETIPLRNWEPKVAQRIGKTSKTSYTG